MGSQINAVWIGERRIVLHGVLGIRELHSPLHQFHSALARNEFHSLSIGAVRSDRRGSSSTTVARGSTRIVKCPLIWIVLFGEEGKTHIDRELRAYDVAHMPHEVVVIDFPHKERDAHDLM